VHKIHLLADTDITFALAEGGHNAGIVAPPGEAGRGHRILTRAAHAPYLDPESWAIAAERRAGSWWTSFVAFLAAQSGPPVAAPRLAPSPLGDAPGLYVRQE